MRCPYKTLKKHWEKELPPAPPYPFGDQLSADIGRRDRRARFAEAGRYCAGIAVVFGFLFLLGSVWGDPRFSPAQSGLDIEEFRNSLPLIREYLINTI